MSAGRWKDLIYGTCVGCDESRGVRRDGRVRSHHDWFIGGECTGSGRLPVEGVRMPCVWCSRHFLSDDDAHRFCSEACVNEWETLDGSWEDWDLEWWFSDREALTIDRPPPHRFPSDEDLVAVLGDDWERSAA